MKPAPQVSAPPVVEKVAQDALVRPPSAAPAYATRAWVQRGEDTLIEATGKAIGRYRADLEAKS